MSDNPKSDDNDDIEVYRANIEDFTPLQDNPNAGTLRGSYILNRAVEKLGAGRSLVADKNGVINAGNHAQAAFVDAGIEDAIVVKTKGDVVVIHQREDWDVTENDGDNPAMEYAFVDNRSSEVGFELDTAVLGAAIDKGLDLGNWYKDKELELMGAKLPEDWQEFDESAADDVEWHECPECSHKWPK